MSVSAAATRMFSQKYAVIRPPRCSLNVSSSSWKISSYADARPWMRWYLPLPWQVGQRVRRPAPLLSGVTVTSVAVEAPAPGVAATLAVSRSTAAVQPVPKQSGQSSGPQCQSNQALATWWKDASPLSTARRYALYSALS